MAPTEDTVHHASGTLLRTCPCYLVFVVLSAGLWSKYQSIDVLVGRERPGSCRAGLVSGLLLCLLNLGCCSVLCEREHERICIACENTEKQFHTHSM